MKKVLILGANGYIGNYLRTVFSDYDVTSVDGCWFDPGADGVIEADIDEFTDSRISEFDVVLLLAGHSSVKMSEGGFLSAYHNNVTNFLKLLGKLSPDQKFIYASSSSVYGDVGREIVHETYNGFKPHNQYDITKHIIDLYAQKCDKQYYGLRFGTVNGYSPIMRSDVMINAMTTSALETGEIKLYIKDIMRPILGIRDLGRAVKAIIDKDEDLRGIYNLASFNKTAEDIANGVSKVVGVPIREYAADPTNITNAKSQTKCYDFSISTDKFCTAYDFEFEETVESITTSIVENYSKLKTTKRDKIYDYTL